MGHIVAGSTLRVEAENGSGGEYVDSSEADVTDILDFRDFVALCERKGQETGEPVLIVASY
jgi:hypothetical protein